MKFKLIFGVGVVIVVIITAVVIYKNKSNMQNYLDNSDEKKITGKYCPNSFIVLNKDEAGTIGFYSVAPTVGGQTRDMPVTYYDASGKVIGGFHIFGDTAENEATMKILDPLKIKFPRTSEINC